MNALIKVAAGMPMQGASIPSGGRSPRMFSNTKKSPSFAKPSAPSAPKIQQPQAAKACCELSFEKEPTLEEIKEKYLGYLIDRHRGHRGRIASILGVSERNTYRMVKKFGMEDK